MYICVCVCVCVHIYIYMCVCVCVCTYIYICMHVSKSWSPFSCCFARFPARQVVTAPHRSAAANIDRSIYVNYIYMFI